MERVIDLLGERNMYLQKFLEINERELLSLVDGNFDTLENFYMAREKILDLLKCIDLLIDEEKVDDNTQTSSAHKHVALELMRQKDDLVKDILAQDLQILTIVENEKSQIIRDLRSVQGVRRVLGNSGETPGGSLDEEA